MNQPPKTFFQWTASALRAAAGFLDPVAAPTLDDVRKQAHDEACMELFHARMQQETWTHTVQMLEARTLRLRDDLPLSPASGSFPKTAGAKD